jgi:hypothetical protein
MKQLRSRIAAFALVGAAVVLTFGAGAGAAHATNADSAKSIMNGLAAFRTANGDYLSLNGNGFMADYMQANAAVFAAHGAIAANDAMDTVPGGCDKYHWSYAKASGPTADASIVSQITTTDRVGVLGNYDHGAAGYVVKGGTTYVAYVLASCSVLPEDEISAGTISLPGTPQQGKPITARVKGFALADPTGPSDTATLLYFWTVESPSGDIQARGYSSSPTYAPQAEDMGLKLGVSVSASAYGYRTADAVSAYTPAVTCPKTGCTA